jgi:hypothetical protein
MASTTQHKHAPPSAPPSSNSCTPLAHKHTPVSCPSASKLPGCSWLYWWRQKPEKPNFSCARHTVAHDGEVRCTSRCKKPNRCCRSSQGRDHVIGCNGTSNRRCLPTGFRPYIQCATRPLHYSPLLGAKVHRAIYGRNPVGRRRGLEVPLHWVLSQQSTVKAGPLLQSCAKRRELVAHKN